MWSHEVCDIILNVCRRKIIARRKCEENVVWQEDESGNRLRGEALTLIAEDSGEEGRVRNRQIQGNKVNWVWKGSSIV